MNGIDRLLKVLELLKSLDRHKYIQLIGELGWSSIPESYSMVESWVVNGHRVEIFKLKSNIIVQVSDVGLFQIM